MAPPAYDLKLANQEGKELEGKKHAEIDAERPSASEVNVSTDDSQDPQITLACMIKVKQQSKDEFQSNWFRLFVTSDGEMS